MEEEAGSFLAFFYIARQFADLEEISILFRYPLPAVSCPSGFTAAVEFAKSD